MFLMSLRGRSIATTCKNFDFLFALALRVVILKPWGNELFWFNRPDTSECVCLFILFYLTWCRPLICMSNVHRNNVCILSKERCVFGKELYFNRRNILIFKYNKYAITDLKWSLYHHLQLPYMWFKQKI